jgi:hypothetical protein
MEPFNLASAFQREAESKAEDITSYDETGPHYGTREEKIDWENLNYHQIEEKLKHAPMRQLLPFCDQQPRRCEETLRKRRLREFGEDPVEDAYRNPVHNYLAAQVRFFLRKAAAEREVISEIAQARDKNWNKAPPESTLRNAYTKTERNQILKEIEEERRKRDLTTFPELGKPETKNSVTLLRFALRRPVYYHEIANRISSQLVEYLRESRQQPHMIQVYSPNLGFDWFPVGDDLKTFKISPAQEHELRAKLATLGLNIDDWAKIFDLEGGRAYYFMSEFERGNFSPVEKYPATFDYFLQKMGLTEETYKQWKSSTWPEKFLGL